MFLKLSLLHYKTIAIDLSKQQALADPKPIQKINFTGNLGEEGTMLFLTEAAKEIFWVFHKGYEGIIMLFYFNIISA